MKNLRRILGFCFVLVASAGLFVACGPTTGADCEFDTDCASNEVCLQPTGDSNRCVVDCTDDSTVCATGEECAPRFPNAGAAGESACIPSDLECDPGVESQCPEGISCGDDGFCAVSGGEEPECTEDADCTGADEVCENEMCVLSCTEDADCDAGQVCEQDRCVQGCTTNADCGTDEVCNTQTGVCESTQGQTYFFLEITDTTDPSSTACTAPNDNDPGSDMMTAELIVDGAGGSTWAKWVWDATTGDPNDLDTPPAHLENGVAPDYDISAETCPENFNDTSILTLGCGGKVWVEFADADGQLEIPTNGIADLYVYEYGSPLCGSDSDDTYKVELCAMSRDDILTANAPGDVDCTGPELIAEGQGEGSVIDITVE